MSCYGGLFGDPSVCGVINGWNQYITGSLALTMFMILLLFLVVGLIFRINTVIVLIFLVPFSLLTLAYVGAGVGGVVILLIGLIVGWAFYSLKR